MFEIYDVFVGKPGPPNFVLDDPDVHGTGSDPVEWWDGPGLGAILIAQGEALRGASVVGPIPKRIDWAMLAGRMTASSTERPTASRPSC